MFNCTSTKVAFSLICFFPLDQALSPRITSAKTFSGIGCNLHSLSHEKRKIVNKFKRRKEKWFFCYRSDQNKVSSSGS